MQGNAIRAGDEAALGAWLTAIHVDGLSIVEHLPSDPDLMPEIPHRIGCLCNSNFGQIWEVESRPDADSNAFTAVALAPHTDMSTRKYVPRLQFLFCLHDSIFVDGYAVAEQLLAESPADYEVLATMPVPFGSRNRDSDHASAPRLRLEGGIERLDRGGFAVCRASGCAATRCSETVATPVASNSSTDTPPI